MRVLCTFLIQLGIGLCGLAAATAGAEEELFNGRDLAGWNGDARLWRAEDGVLVGETDDAERKIGRNSFLVWEGGEPGDFEIELKARITGNNNSGFQYRSRVTDAENFVVQGYQMDMHPNQPYNAMLYEEGGRGILCLRGQSVVIDEAGERQIEPLEEGVPETDLSEWNAYRLVAKGAVVEHWLNGKLAARIEDRQEGKLARKGVIALQLHAGPPMRVEFKEIRLKRLSEEEPTEDRDAAAVPVEGGEVHWIWSREQAGEAEETFLRRAVMVPAGVKQALLISTADNNHKIYIDGQEVAASTQWETPVLRNVNKFFSRPGRRVLAAVARNEGAMAGFAMRLELTMQSGEKRVVVSDADWRWSEEGPTGWEQPEYDDSEWKTVTTLGKMGAEPWGYVFGDAVQEPSQGIRDVTAEFKLLPDFKLERVYEVPRLYGSWVALAVDGEGRLIGSDQQGQLYRLTLPPADQADAVGEAEALDLPITGAQGLLWAHDALYVVTSLHDAGVYRIADENGDGELEHVEKIKTLRGGGEHGPHGLVLSPDGKWIYMVAGNHTDLPEFDATLVPPVWGEDQLLPRRPDARGHARGRMAPGGWIARFTPDGSHWELVSAGYRNAYGLAFDFRGELFTYDSDMEWDLGTPWYRPTRICHVTSGSEFGWRHGTGKWPAYYEDSLPSVLDIGPGSPTGVVAGQGLKFPARYQHALFMLDWTFATIYAVHLAPEGASYTATTEEFVAGTGLPVTDVVVGTDGALYFTTGGRQINSAVYRITYTGDQGITPAPAPVDEPEALELAELRRSLEALHHAPGTGALDGIWSALAHHDRFIRFAARTALEHLPVESWKARLLDERDEWRTILSAMALARTGATEDQATALEALDRLEPEQLDEARSINLMRAYGLIFARHGPPDEALRASLITRFGAMYPASGDNLNRELCRLLVYLESPSVVAKTLRLMASSPSTEAPAWADLATRNARYGQAVREMIENMPPAQNMFYAYCLRAFEGSWTEGQRRQFFAWFSEAAQKSGGMSYQGFVEDLRKEALKRATPEEREMVESWDLNATASPFANLPSPEGPGRAWTVDEAVAVAEKGLAGRDQQNGRRMYEAALCAACHRVGGDGGGAGPDLTAAAGRFAIRDLIEAIIHPDREVSDQYQFDLITMRDGSAMTGKIVEERDDVLIVATSPFDFTRTREIPRSTVERIEPSPKSPMPAGLINRLNEEELRDLLAFLMNEDGTAAAGF